MTIRGNLKPDEVKEVAYTDWWIMNADGSGKRRLTYFNQEGRSHLVVWGTVAADFAWLPDGRRLLGYYHTLTLEHLVTGKFKEVIVRIDFAD